jgi:hypothetical protein
MPTTQTIFLILGSLFLFLSVLSLIYQVFSASILAFAGIVFLNLANNWFDWYWLVWFLVLTIIASLGGFLLTFKASQKLPKNKEWMPILFGILGAIFIPIPFVGALAGVFAGTLFAMSFFPTSQFTQEKLNIALEITYKSFLGLVLEITCVVLMFISLVLLIIFSRFNF